MSHPKGFAGLKELNKELNEVINSESKIEKTNNITNEGMNSASKRINLADEGTSSEREFGKIIGIFIIFIIIGLFIIIYNNIQNNYNIQNSGNDYSNKNASSSLTEETKTVAKNEDFQTNQKYKEKNIKNELDNAIKPPLYTSVLDKNELLYCIAESIRINTMKENVDKYSLYEVDLYNSYVKDYNERCNNKQYYIKDMDYVNTVIEKNKNLLIHQGLERLKKYSSSNLYKENKDLKSNTPLLTKQIIIQYVGYPLNNVLSDEWHYLDGSKIYFKNNIVTGWEDQGMLNISSLEKKLKNHLLYTLNISTIPSNARIRIMNIKPKYYNGIKLKKGKYHIVITKKGYEKIDKWIYLDKDTFLTFTLKKHKL